MSAATSESPLKRTPEEWDAFFYTIADRVASLSKDPERKVGAVIVAPGKRQMSFGYNGFPPHIEDLPTYLFNREFKLANMVHAEDNALRQAPFPTAGCAVYVTRFPCFECAGKLREAGVTKVVAPPPDLSHHRWGFQWRGALMLFETHGIEVVAALP